MAVSVTCTKSFVIPEAESGIPWSTINWTFIDYFEAPPLSNSSGTTAGNLITCACDGTPATSSGGLAVTGDLVYTGPLVNCKVTITGGPYPSPPTTTFSLKIDHTTGGNLLTVLRADVTTSPQDFLFVVPVSVADTISIYGGGGSNILVLTQNPPGVINLTITFANQ